MNVGNNGFHLEYVVDLYFPKGFTKIMSFNPQRWLQEVCDFAIL